MSRKCMDHWTRSRKRILAILLCSVCVFGLYNPWIVEADAVGSPKLAVLVDGRKVKFQGGDPIFEQGRVQVPLRGIGEALKAEIGFSGKTVSYKKDGRSIVLTIGSKEAVVDGKKVTMDTPAKSIKGRTYVPLRFVSENLGIPVSWDQVGNWAWIGSKEVPDIEKSHIAKQPISKKFIDLVSTNKYLIKDKSSVRVFTIDDLPLKFGQVTVYDVWTVKINEYQAVRVRYSLGRGNIFYLGEGDRARFRSNMSHEKNSDQTVTITYQTTSQGDELREGDKNYMSFNLHKAEYIGFDRGSDSLELLQNPFRQ